MVSSMQQKQDMLEERVSKMEQETVKMIADIDSVTKSVARVDGKIKEFSDGTLTEKCVKLIDGKIKSELSRLDEAVRNMKEKVESIDTKVETAIEAKLVDPKSTEIIKRGLEPSWTQVVSQSVDSKLQKVTVDVTKVQQTLADVKVMADEERDRENRSHNVIIYRVAESGAREDRVKTDKAFCMKLLKDVLRLEVQEADVKSVFRLGKRETGQTADRPLMVQFRDKSVKNSMMESLYRLREAEDNFKNISVTHDVTQSERSECKKLVEEAKKKQQEEQGNSCGGYEAFQGS